VSGDQVPQAKRTPIARSLSTAWMWSTDYPPARTTSICTPYWTAIFVHASIPMYEARLVPNPVLR
jgi:hypothetical protein